MRAHSHRLSRYTWCVLIASFGACTTSTGRRPTPAQPAARPSTNTDSTPAALPNRGLEHRFRITPGIRRYLVVNDASITLNSDTTHQSYISTRAYYTLEVNHANQAVRGTLDSVATRRQGAIPTPPDSTLTLPITWTVANLSSSCSYDQRLIEQGRTIIPPLPAELLAGTSWHDTTSLILCILERPAMATVINEYTVVGQSTFRTDSTFLVARVSHLQFTRDSTSTELPYLEAVTGTIRSELHLDPKNGELLTRTDEGQLELLLRTRSRLTRVTQDLRGQVVPILPPDR